MNSRIFFAFLLALFFLAVFVLTGYASNIFVVSKQATYENTKSIDCSNFLITVNPKLSSYDQNKDVLTILIYNAGFEKISVVKVFLSNKTLVFKPSLDPGLYYSLSISKFSSFKTNNINICLNNCTSNCYHVDVKDIKGYH